MSMGQMLLVLLGLALFSTLIMSYYSTFASQIDWIEKNQIQKQALRIVDFHFQLIESRIISGTSVNAILPEYGNFFTPMDTMFVNNIPYKVYLRAQPSKADGDTLNVPSPPQYIKMNARIVAYRADKDSVEVGLVDLSISKVFGDVFMPGS
ncbi:MAG TPA: hypothetical protein PKJ08_11730 [Candidatus Cloacimonadota bacterium]|jgi:hypothetical protein|nr:hypothetical protein [Candidatus Cloacimonadota bacterium]HPM02176.1 hypothetical protein [Candidatus Cloacimonadota bacterium]